MRQVELSTLLNKPLHFSWHLTGLAAGILAGTALIPVLTDYTFTDSRWLLVVIALLLPLLLGRQRWLVIGAFISGLILGLYSGSVADSRLAKYEPYFGQMVHLSGHIADDTTYSSRGELQLRLNHITIDGRRLPGEVWTSTMTQIELKRGDHIQLKGQLEPGFGSMSATLFRATLIEAIRPSPGDIARRVRDRFTDYVRLAIPEPQSLLGVSYLTGQRGLLPGDISQQLRLLGLAHIVVASGFHLTIVTRYFHKLLRPISKYLTTFFSLTVIASFLLLTGFSTSMVRASLVASLSLLAWYYGRQIHPIVLLLSVAATTVLIDPAVIWGDIGWFLSFTAFTGVIILAPLLHDFFWGSDKEPGAVRHIAVGTIAAQITTFPVVALVFGQYSPLALLANLLLLPFIPITMGLTLLSGLGAAFLPSLASIFGAPAYALLLGMTTVTDWLALSPYATSELNFSVTAVAISYVLITLLMVYLWRVTKHNFRRYNPIV
ncbi:MAG: ComEC/Rec2 family competence protein [Candidatus Saccharimonadales bacterium]